MACLGIGSQAYHDRLGEGDSLGIDLVEHAGKGDGLADVLDAADPGHRPLDAHAEAGVGNRSDLIHSAKPVN